MVNYEKEKPVYSVLMAVYVKDNPEWFKIAIDSMLNQSIFPDEFVIVKDGPITLELEKIIIDRQQRYPDLFNVVGFTTNRGLGEALRLGVESCKNEYIARMDSDDYSEPERCEKQLQIITQKKADIVGCDVSEFVCEINNVVACRLFPENHAEIEKFAKRRTPFAHPAVILKKSQVLQAGNYRTAYLHEDFDLFVRLLQNGCKGYTIKESLVYMRVSEDFYERRGGIVYLRALLAFNHKLYKNGWMSLSDYLMRSLANIISCLMPNKIRDLIYRRVLRK